MDINSKQDNTDMAKSFKQAPATQVKPNEGGPVKYPNPNDVLSGRGGRINSHAGNIYFRKIVTAEKVKYLSMHKKMDKALIAVDIVEQIRKLDPPGRFLKQDAETLYWYEIGDERARKKAGQALREDGPGLRKVIDKEENSSSTYNMFKGYNDFSRQPFSNSTYPAPPYPYMPRTNAFHDQMFPSHATREYLMGASSAITSKDYNQMNLMTSSPPFDKPSQFSQLNTSQTSQYSREYMRPNIPPLPNLSAIRQSSTFPGPQKSPPCKPATIDEYNHKPSQTIGEKTKLPNAMDFEPIPLSSQKRRRSSKPRKSHIDKFRTSLSLNDEDKFINQKPRRYSNITNYQKDHSSSDEFSLSSHNSDKQLKHVEVVIDNLDHSFPSREDEHSKSLGLEIDDLIIETFSRD